MSRLNVPPMQPLLQSQAIRFAASGRPEQSAGIAQTLPLQLGEISASSQSGKALKALFQGTLNSVKFGSASSALTETALTEKLNTIGVPEMNDIIDAAKVIAKKHGHAEVAALHILAAQFEEMASHTANKTEGSAMEEMGEQMEGGRSVFNATVGILLGLNTPPEVAFHLERSLEKINDALKTLPGGATGEPTLSRNVLDILNDELVESENLNPSEERMKKEAEAITQSELARRAPQMVVMKKEMETQVAKHTKTLKPFAEALAPFEKLFEEIPQLKEVTMQLLRLQFDIELVQQGKMPKFMKIADQSGMPIKLDKLSPQMVQQLSSKLLPGMAQTQEIFGMLVNKNLSKVQAIAGEEGNLAEALMNALPDNALDAYLHLEQDKAELGKISEEFNKASKPLIEKMKASLEKQLFRSVLVSPYNRRLTPQQLQDPGTAEAQKIYQNFYEILSSGSSVQTDNIASYLKTAQKNGAGDAEIKALSKALSLIKQVSSTFGRNKGEGEADPSSVNFRIKLLQQASNFVEAYSGIDWKGVQSKKVDLTRAKKILDENDLIPTPIKKDLLNFVKSGNRNQWQNQPLLLLTGGGGTDMVKQAVVSVLNEILDMPVYRPKGEITSMVMIGNGGRAVKGDPTLSPAAKALVETKTPQSIVYIDNLLRFSVAGGQKIFDELASSHGRQNFQEPDLDVPFNLSPFVFVASLEDGMTGGYLSALHGDHFNDSDMTMIHLGEDIDTFTKEKVANRTAKAIELQYNVRFGPDVVKTICRDFAIWGRHDMVQDKLREAAKAAAGSVVSSNGPIEIKVEDLETKLLGPKATRFTNNRMTIPTVGSINGLSAGGAGVGSVLRIGITKLAEWEYDPRKDHGGRYLVKAALGPVTQMTSDSAKKALESNLTDYLNNTAIGVGDTYKLLQGLRHKAMTFQVVFPENVDGPSAGAAMAATAISVVTNIPIRPDVAVTGTIQDKGTVGAIGGIFGKTKASYEAGIKKILMPEVNHIELQKEHPRFFAQLQKEGIELIGVKTMDDVLKNVLTDYDALFKEPTAEQLKLDQYDPLGTFKKEEDDGGGRLETLLEKVLAKVQKENGNTLETVLEKVLSKLIAPKQP